jgi:ribosomal protein L20A (L18A)
VDNKIVFETYTRSQKIVNLHRDPRITVLVEDGLEYQNLRGVMIQGTATLHEDQEAVQGFAREVVLRNEPEVPAELVDQVAARMAAKRTAVVIEPTKTISWDHTKLG